MMRVINTLAKTNLLKSALQLTFFFFFFNRECSDLFKYLVVYHEILKANLKGKGYGALSCRLRMNQAFSSPHYVT